jgi:hypothetical protein
MPHGLTGVAAEAVDLKRVARIERVTERRLGWRLILGRRLSQDCKSFLDQREVAKRRLIKIRYVDSAISI